MKTTTRHLHPAWKNLDFIAVSARLRQAVEPEHGNSAADLACEELVKTTSTWSHISDPRKFAEAVKVLVNNLTWSGGMDTSLRRRKRRVEVPEEIVAAVPETASDAAVYRLRQYLGVLEREFRDVNDRQLREHLRYELRRDARPTFDVLWSQLAVKKDLCVEDVVNLIVEIEPTGEFPFETQEIGNLTYIDLKYRRVLVIPTTFTSTLKKLYPFTVKDSKILKTVKGAPRGVDIFAIRCLDEFLIDAAMIERLEKRLVPFDWTSQSIQKSLIEIGAEDAEREATLNRRADPTPQDVNDVTQMKALTAIEAGLETEAKELSPAKVFSGKKLLPRVGSVVIDAQHAVENATADEVFSKATAIPISPDEKPVTFEGMSCDLSFRQEPKGKPMKDVKNSLERDEIEEGSEDETTN